MEVRQGEIYWVDIGEPRGSAPGFTRPFIVIQNNLFNQTRINTVLVCGLTTNISRASSSGNVLLSKGEANLPKQSVVVVSQTLSIDKAELRERIGAVSRKRIDEIVEGIKLLIEPRELESE